MAKGNKHFPGLPCLVFLLTFLFIHTVHAAEFHRTQIIRSIPLTIIINSSASREKDVFKAMQNIFETAHTYFDLWCLENKSGDIYKINHSAGVKPVKVDAETIKLITKALLIREQTNGVFDILYPTPLKFRTFNPAEIEINTTRNTVYLPNPHFKIDTNGMAKGQILDILSQTLDTFGFKKYLINAGGDLQANGYWPICLKNPSKESTHCAVEIHVKNKAVMTTGNYERGVHVFDPKNPGFLPRYKSTTVIHSSASLAGPLAVALFVKPELGYFFKRQYKNIRIYIQ